MACPEWLTKEYLEAALRNHHKNPALQLIDSVVKPALGQGENYGGVLSRVRAKYQLTPTETPLQKSFIVKFSYEDDEFSREKMAPYDIFKREMSIYENVLPKLNALLAEMGDEDQLFASAIHVDYERQVLIFEDLSERGYVMADRTQGLDMPHIQLILRKLAKMHATSAVLNERETGCLEHYDRGFFNRYTDNYASYFVHGLMTCGRFVQGWPAYRKYADKLLALGPHYMEIGKRCFAPTPGHVNVFCHGDVWTNNVMFKYDAVTKQPVDVIIIDFQYSFWGSGTLDLHHFFNTSLREPIRLHQQDVLFQFYHAIFSNTLKRLNYSSVPVPSLKRFMMEVERKRFFALHSACVIQPVMLNEDPRDADFNSLMGVDERAVNFKRRLYDNVKIQENLRNLLPFFDHKGLLEVNQCD